MARPQRYTEDELLELLRQTRSEITQDLTPYLLEKHTGVSKTVWRSCMTKQIEQLNQAFNDPYSDSGGINSLALDNVLSIYEKHKDNEKVLLTKLKSYDLFVNNILKTTSKVKHLEETLQQTEKTSRQRIQELEEKVATLKEERDHFENEYLETIGQSTYREQYRIRQTEEPLSMDKQENVEKVDFIARNRELFE